MRSLNVTVVATSVVVSLLVAHPRAQSVRFGSGSIKGYERETKEEMPYWVFKPTGVKPGRLYPIVLALHGTNGKAENFCRKISGVSTASQPVFVVAPQHQYRGGKNKPNYANRIEGCQEILERVIAGHPIDCGRMFMFGFSRGGQVIGEYVNHGWEPDEPFPFRACYATGNGIHVRGGSAPDAQYVLLIGENDRWSGKDVPGLICGTYRRQFPSGIDVDYDEIPKIKHAVTQEVIDRMIAHMARYPAYDESSVVQRPMPEAVDPARLLALRGDFGPAFERLAGAREEAGDGKEGREITSVTKKLVSHVKKRALAAAKTSRANPPTIHRILEARRQAAALAQVQPDLAKAWSKADAKLTKKRGMADELAAHKAFMAAWKALGSSVDEGNRMMRILAEGDFADTEYGRRAARHLHAWGR